MRKLFDIDLYITRYIFIGTHSVHPPPLPHVYWGNWASYQIFKKGGACIVGTLVFRGSRVGGKEGGVNFFRGVAIFT